MANSQLGNLPVGEGFPVRIMGAINVSPESFYKGSIRTEPDEVAKLAHTMIDEGAEIIDIGAMSTAPYLETYVTSQEEERRLVAAIKAVREVTDAPISADTVRARIAEASLKAGADIINDVSGLKNDEQMAEVIANNHASAILVANEREPHHADPVDRVLAALKQSFQIARKADIPLSRLVVDPGIGFFRKNGKGFGFYRDAKWPWYIWNCVVLQQLSQLRHLELSVCLSVSRKAFIGKILGLDKPEDRLFGSLSAAAIAAYNGADIIRTHDVMATIHVVRIAEAIRDPKKLTERLRTTEQSSGL